MSSSKCIYHFFFFSVLPILFSCSTNTPIIKTNTNIESNELSYSIDSNEYSSISPKSSSEVLSFESSLIPNSSNGGNESIIGLDAVYDGLNVYKYNTITKGYCLVQTDINSNSQIVIPDNYNGIPIKEIMPNIFNILGVKEIVIGKNVQRFYEEYITPIQNTINIVIDKQNQYLSYENGLFVNKNKTNLLFALYDLDEITIKSSISSIDSLFFEPLNNLKTINVENGNSAFSSVNGILFDRNQEEVIKCPIKYEGEYALPTSVKKINSRAFVNCKKLEELTCNEGLISIEKEAFIGCGITSIVLPSTLLEINESAFTLTNLKEIALPKSLHVLENFSRVFSGCRNLKNVNVDSENVVFKSIDGIVYNKSLTSLIYQPMANDIENLVLPNTVKSIECELFNLKTIDINDSIENIYNSAFTYCPNISSTEYLNCIYLGNSNNKYLVAKSLIDTSTNDITIHKDCKIVLNSIFEIGGLNSLSRSPFTFHIEDGSDSLFAVNNGIYTKNKETLLLYDNWDSKEDIVLLEKTKDFRSDCFSNKNLGTINVGSNFNVEKLLQKHSIGNMKFYSDNTYCKIENDLIYSSDFSVLYRYIGNDTNVKLNDNVKIISKNCFYSNRTIESVNFGAHLEEIGESAFSGCYNLKELSLPDSVKRIDTYAFHGCAISEVILNGDLEYIGDGAFASMRVQRVTLSGKIDYIGLAAFKEGPYYFDTYIPQKNDETIDIIVCAEKNSESIKEWNDRWFFTMAGHTGGYVFYFSYFTSLNLS